VAENRIVVRLDQRLIKDGIIDALIEKDYKKVHDMLNTHVRKTGKILTEETFKKGDDALRSWLMLLHKKGASQEKLTSYLRCGLAHLCFDFIESTYESIDPDELITRALLSFKNRGYQKSFFKVSAAEIAKLKAKKKAAKKKAGEKAVKTVKSSKAKNSKRKAVKKKPASKAVKKAASKKGAVKKAAAVKKGTVKKTPAKKAGAGASKKAAVKKSSAKKSAAKKPAAKNKKPGAKGNAKSKQKKPIKSILSKFLKS